MLASERGHTATIEYLVIAGADIEGVTKVCLSIIIYIKYLCICAFVNCYLYYF